MSLADAMPEPSRRIWTAAPKTEGEKQKAPTQACPIDYYGPQNGALYALYSMQVPLSSEKMACNGCNITYWTAGTVLWAEDSVFESDVIKSPTSTS